MIFIFIFIFPSSSLNPSYEKAFFRRGSALFGLNDYAAAKKDFQSILNFNKSNKDAAEKVKACDKCIKQKQFLEAMHVEEQPQIDPTSIDKIPIESGYAGPNLESESGEFVMTPALAIEIMGHFKDQKNLAKRYMMRLLIASAKQLSELTSLVHIGLPRSTDGKVGEITVCGDTHGQYYDLCNIFALNGLPSASNPYLFNGDFVDRGSFSVEVITTLLAWKLADPSCMHLTRGNHESKSMNKIYGFEGEVMHKYDVNVMNLFTEVFNWLPLSAVIERKVFVVHGGLSCDLDGKIDLHMIESLSRHREPPQGGLMSDLLWADPHPGTGKVPSKRGMGVCFGSDYTERFLAHNKLELLVRSHEVKEEGYEVDHNGKCITIFSAPNYCDTSGNKGAFIRFGADCKPNFTKFEHVPHPNVPPMRYANNMFGF